MNIQLTLEWRKYADSEFQKIRAAHKRMMKAEESDPVELHESCYKFYEAMENVGSWDIGISTKGK